MITDFQVWSECYATMGGIVSTIPQQGFTLVRVSQDDISGKLYLRELSLGVLWHGILQTGGQPGCLELHGGGWCSTVQWGFHRQSEGHCQMFLLPVWHMPHMSTRMHHKKWSPWRPSHGWRQGWVAPFSAAVRPGPGWPLCTYSRNL